jgi:predicted short-subunit dehydrogenase-like oxidoreductase (DUF2520 family)
MVKLTLIGPGRLGMSLTRLWLQSGRVQLDAVVASSTKKAGDAVSRLERSLGKTLRTQKLAAMDEIINSELILLATPDDELLECTRRLVEEADLSTCRQLFFCSGCIESAAVAEAANHSVPVVGVHPMMSFSSQLVALDEFEGVICTYEGVQADPDSVVDLFRAIGGRAVPIAAESKLRYHLGTVIACNYINALRMMAEDHLIAAGMDTENIQAGLSKLMTQTISNIDSCGAIEALTGPIARGDIGLIERQIDLLENDGRHSQIYRGLAEVLLDKLEMDEGVTEERVRLRALLNSRLHASR